MISIKSIKMRLKLVISLLTRSTNMWIDELTSGLENVGLKYQYAKANLSPIEFLRRLLLNARIQNIRTLDYSQITSHDFSQGMTDIDCNWSSEPEVARFIGDLVYNLSSTCVVEAGCFVGFGSAHLATALCELGSGRDLFVVDVEKRFLDITKTNLDLLSLGKLSLHLLEGKSWDPNVLEFLPNNVDIIFLDSDHSYEGIKKELGCYLPKLSRNGLVIVHDSILWPGVRRAILELPDVYDKITFATSRGSGVSVILHVKDA